MAITHHASALSAAALLLLCFPGTVTAYNLELSSGDTQNILVELYTSQGCSSCPPAERWLGKFKHHPELWTGIIPVAFHVDYWDYLGWKDELAQPAFSQRQRQYRREGATSSVYTPGILINGKEWRQWYRLPKVPDSTVKTGVLKVNIAGNRLRASYPPAGDNRQPYHLNIAILGVGIHSHIKRGENAGKDLSQDFSVLSFSQATSRSGQWLTNLPDIQNRKGVRPAVAIWVSHGEKLLPLQAVGGWLQLAN